ncbi:formate/nitrite transporter family protein [Carnimonas nigrificans]|uniref:formate/nitrite transporter family protein n=1 Tax=Carnimonas nigrificans TaxID=64323 RepID=UPI0004B979BD|nr:formate/nitrite transporter family protein [Carnimonas nigrificans]
MAIEDANMPSKAAAVHEKIRQSGEKELGRDFMALWWSAVAGGITMSTSLIARALLHTYLPDSDMGFLIDAMGYTVGFILVITANQQLFTENTVTPVLPFMSNPSLSGLGRLLRIWFAVLFGNLVGAAVAAAIITWLPIFEPPVIESIKGIGMHMMENTPSEMFAKGLLAGWLIATLVWILSSLKSGQIVMIFLITYVIALGNFTHIIVGVVEVLFLMMNGMVGWYDAIFVFFFPVLLGNMIGGIFIFALISHAQVRSDG